MQRNLGKLLVGNGLGQAIQLLSILLLSRLYDPAAFGTLGQVQSYATVAAILATLQLHLSIPLSRDEADARQAVARVTAIACLLLVVGFPLTLIAAPRYGFSVLLAFFIGMANTYNGYLIFSGHFGKISRFYVYRAILIVVVQIALACLGVEDGLIWGAVGGEGLTALYLAYISGNAQLPRLSVIASLRDYLQERKSFALFGTMQELVSVSAFYSPLLLFGIHFGDDVVGQYAMASRLIWAPAVLLSGSLTQVLYHQYGSSQAKHALAPAFLLLPHKVYYLVLAFAPLLCYALQGVVVIALGDKWEQAGQFMPVMLAWACVFIVSTPARVVCRMLAQQKYHLMIDAGMLLAVLVLFSYFNLSPIQSMYGIFIVACVQTLAIFLISLRAIGAARGKP